jgi:hypothetical protein
MELVAERNRWETPELAAEVRAILDAIDAPPANDQVMFEFQKTLHRSRIFGEDGRGKIILACRCILESQGNEDAFSEPFVSAVLSAAGTEFADRGLELIEAFDQIRLVEILETMRSLEYFRISEAESALRQIVRNKLRRILFPPQPEPVKPPSGKERRAADKQATAAANRRIVEQKIELGRRLAELRDSMPNNRRFGAAVRKLGHDDPLHVAEVMRVARLYGDRPEIFCNASWHALTELASSATSDEERRTFEARIFAGGRVNGAALIRAREAREQAAAKSFLSLAENRSRGRP